MVQIDINGMINDSVSKVIGNYEIRKFQLKLKKRPGDLGFISRSAEPKKLSL